MFFLNKLVITFFVLLQLAASLSMAQSYNSPKQAKQISRTYGFVGTLADLGVYYSQSQATANPAAGNSFSNETSVYDVKLGYISESHYYFGALYSAGSDNQVSSNKASRGTVGAGIGYFGYNGFNLRAYYLLSSTYGDYKDGTGYQVDLGYAINPTSSFYLGLAMSLREVNYKTNATISGFESWVRKETYPFITIGFLIN